jgi:hypothetical protein
MTTLEEAINSLSEEELDLLNSDPEMLVAFQAKYGGIPALKGDLTPSLGTSDVTNQGTKTTNPIAKIGTAVEAGGAGIGDIVTGKGLPQAAETVRGVLDEEPLKTTSGKVGKFAGSFFTPTQIALQATGAKVVPSVLKGLGKGANTFGKWIARSTEAELPAAQKGASEVIGALTGAEPEALQQVMLNAPRVKAAASFPQLADEMATAMNKLGSHIGDLEKAANATLNAEKLVSTEPMLNAIATARAGLGEAALPEVTAMKQTLDELAKQVAAKGNMISEAKMAEWIKSLQKGINWNDPTGTVRNEALSKIQGITNDALKAINPAYAKAEAKLAETISLKDGIAQSMGLTKDPGKAWAAKDVAVTKLKGLLNPENKASTVKLLKELSKIPGMKDILKEVELAAAKESITAPATGAHKMFGLGTRLPALGGVLAGLVPKIPEAVAGGLPYAVRSVPAIANAVYQGLKQ